MNTWTSGYVADVDYTYGYYTELNPLRSKFAMLHSGIISPEYTTACELGFGQGLSTNIHAAASNVEWYGTDFNPSQAGFARELQSQSKANVKLYDEAFLEFCNRKDLPDFDFICLHGIWSWISDENRTVIVEFIRRKLKVGGVVFVSYNTLPGWAAFAPMRHLMTQHAEMVGSSASGIISRVDGAINFAEQLLDVNPLYAIANPQVKERLKAVKAQNRHYLAHEYFNRDWGPMHFSTMAQWLERAKLDYACSAIYLDQLNSVNLTEDQIKFLNEVPDVLLKESVRDFLVNSQFRRDYWVRGRRRLSPIEQMRLLKDFRVMLCANRKGLKIKLNGDRGEVTPNMEIYDPILDFLADFKITTIDQITAALEDNPQIGFQQVVECMLVLIGSGYVCAVQNDDVIASAKTKTDSLNSYLLNKAKSGSEINSLASPIMGGGIDVNQIQQHFILAMAEGHQKPEDLAKFTWEILSIRRQKLIINGKELQTQEEHLDKLNKDAEKFVNSDLEVFKALKII